MFERLREGVSIQADISPDWHSILSLSLFLHIAMLEGKICYIK
jgi:hypothetical protein